MNLKEVSKLINYQGSYLACPLYCHLVEFNVRKFLLVHRKELRRRIFEYIEHSSSIKPLSESQKQTFLQPGVIPQIPDLSLSISHGPFLGGFVASTY